jgi:hypothetical protein
MMTTPTDGDDWITAREATELLPHSTRVICLHAKEGLVRARARLLIWGDERRNNANVPPEFWWAEGDEALTQDWRSGYFETWSLMASSAHKHLPFNFGARTLSN